MNVGIIGDGQLGRMLALSGYPLGINFGFLGGENSPSANLGKLFTTIEELDEFADVITYESENTNIELLEALNTPVFPTITALKATQNRTREKELFATLGIPSTRNITINSLEELRVAVDTINTPCVLKTTTQGYDGKGQFLLRDTADITTAWHELQERELIVEGFVNFDYEISIIAAFTKNDSKYYPITKNTHSNGILRTSEVIDNTYLQQQAQQYINAIAQQFNYIGILTVEFFVKEHSSSIELIVNEIAPRVHNSGHWSIDGAKVSQFENHIRSICNLPLGSTEQIYSNVVMENIIGTLPNQCSIMQQEDCFLHLYDKKERENRKLGHITLCKR